ncbi:MAG: response regulator transcription factor [Acidobacteria bacterium]|nr:response regulator transcription factor [Acidobacteriota bacterium]
MSIMPTETLQVLIIEDDWSQSNLLAAFLETRQYQVHQVPTAKEALDCDFAPHFILLDLNLPDIDGLRLSPLLRERFPSAFIVMLTARQEEIDRIVGLESGADDYITKPYSLREVDARMRAIIRRHQRTHEKSRNQGGLTLEPDRCCAHYHGKQTEFTAQEFRVLETLVHAPRRILSRNQLMDQAWDEGLFITDRAVDAMVARIRKKLRHAFDREFLFTKHGLGYGYDPEA